MAWKPTVRAEHNLISLRRKDIPCFVEVGARMDNIGDGTLPPGAAFVEQRAKPSRSIKLPRPSDDSITVRELRTVVEAPCLPPVVISFGFISPLDAAVIGANAVIISVLAVSTSAERRDNP